MTINQYPTLPFLGNRKCSLKKIASSLLIPDILSWIPVATALLNENGKIIRYNKYFTSLLHNEKKQLKGKNFLNILGIKSEGSFDAMLSSNIVPEKIVYNNPSKESLLRLKINSIRKKSGNPKLYIAILEDITDLNQHTQLNHISDLAKVIEAQEMERKRISEELHDNVNQMLATVKMIIDHMKNNNRPGKLLLRKCSDYLSDVINELRNIAHSLSSSWLEEHGLEMAIRKLAAMIEDAGTITVKINTDYFTEGSLSSHKKLLLFRIMQEQIQNILKHSKASAVSIILNNAAGQGLLKITDNGVGSSSAKTNGIGLRNIRSRVEVMAGTMNIVTAPGKGFTMEITF
jgi:PAS domain S-box-containing protein